MIRSTPDPHARYPEGTKTCGQGHIRSAYLTRCHECRRIRERENRTGIRETIPKDNRGVIPVERLRPIVERAILEHGAQDVVSELTGVPARRIYEIRTGGPGKKCSFSLADRLLVGLDLQYLWFFPAEHGGLEDLYGSAPTMPSRAVEVWDLPWDLSRQTALETAYRQGVRTAATRQAKAYAERQRAARARDAA